MKQKTLNVFKILSLSLVLSTAIGYVFAAWTPAPGAPTGGNPNPPINTSANAQTKTGDLTVSPGNFIATTGYIGTIGVNNVAPSERLDVVGNIKSSGKITADIGAGEGLCLGASCITSWLQAIDLSAACPANEFVTNIINGVATCDPATAGTDSQGLTLVGTTLGITNNASTVDIKSLVDVSTCSIAGQFVRGVTNGVPTCAAPAAGGAVSSVTGSGAGISVSPTTDAVIVRNTGVTSLTQGTGITLSGSTGAITISASGSGGITGTGAVAGRIPVWTTATNIGSSKIYTSTNSNYSTLQNIGINTSGIQRSGFTIKGASEEPEGGIFSVRNQDDRLVFRVGQNGGFSSGPTVPDAIPPATYYLTGPGSHDRVFQVDLGSTNVFSISNAGRVGMGVLDPTDGQLEIRNLFATGAIIRGYTNTGTEVFKVNVAGGVRSASLAVAQNCVSHDAGGLLINCLSDSRLKKNIASISDSMDVLSALKQLRGVYFNWDTSVPAAKDMGEGKNIGLIAQEVEKVFPEAVATDAEGYKSLDKSALVGFLIEVNKKQQAEIESLQSRIEKLEQK
jgi:hypothetical protein